MSDKSYAAGLIEQGVDAFTLFQSTLHAGVDVGSLHVVAKEIKRRLADPENEIHHYFHRHPNADGSLGGWVQNENSALIDVDPAAHIGPEALILGPFCERSFAAVATVLGKGTVVTGRSVVGPGVVTRGKTVIDHSFACGVEVANDGLSYRGIFGNRMNLSGVVDLMQCQIEDSTLSHSIAAGSVLRHATVKEQTVVAFSNVKNSEVDGANLHATTLKDGGKVGKEVTASNCEIKNAVVDGPRILADEKIADDRYALNPRPKTSSGFRHFLEEAKHLFSRSGAMPDGANETKNHTPTHLKQ